MDFTLEGRGQDFELSAQLGEGGASMSLMVQKTITDILTPLAQRVVDLEEKSQLLLADMKAFQAQAEAMTSRADIQENSLNKANVDISGLASELERTKENLGELSEKHTISEGDHDSTKVVVSQINNAQKTASAAISDLQRQLEDVDNKTRSTQAALAETNIVHLNINDTAAELRNRQEGLNDRHLELIKSLQETKQSDENTRQALRRLAGSCDKQKREAEKNFVQLNDRTKNAEVSLVELNHSLEVAQRSLKGTKTELAQLSKQVVDVIGCHQNDQPATSVQSLPSGVVRSQAWGVVPSSASDDKGVGPRVLQNRVMQLEANFVKISKTQASDKTQTLAVCKQLSETITKNSDEISKTASETDSLEKGLKHLDNRVSSDIASRIEATKELITKIDGEIRSFIASGLRDSEVRFLAQSSDLAKTNAIVQQTGQRLDLLNIGVQNLQSELNAAGTAVTKLQASSDLAQDYFHGISKGFQDTHKRVLSGQDGMLAPKGIKISSLPSLSG